MTNLARLEEIARAATAGPWEATPYGFIEARTAAVCQMWDKCEDNFQSHKENAAHIAAFDPPTVLAMLAVCRAAAAWWEEGRPISMTEASHMALPAVNRCGSDAEAALAESVAVLKDLEALKP